MAFGSNSFPLGPNGQFPKQRVGSSNHAIAAPNRVEDVYGLSGSAKLPVTEKDYHSSVGRVNKMKKGSPNVHSEEYTDIDKFRPKYAHRSSLRKYVGTQPVGDNEWLKRRKQRFPGLESIGPEVASDIARERARKLNPATGMSGVGFFGRNGNLGDVEQKYREDEAQRLGYYTRRPYR